MYRKGKEMQKTLHYEELLDIVSAANIAGHMEHAERIVLGDDEQLLELIEQEMPRYASAVETAIDENPNDAELFNWYDWIEAALLREYGMEENRNDP